MTIICEMATNWGDMNEAKSMIFVAKVYSAGLVKFQLFDAEDDKGKPYYQWVKDHELTYDQAKELFEYGAGIGMEVFFSVFHPRYVEWCERIGVKRYKIAAGARDTDLLRAVEQTGKTVIVSTRLGECRHSWEEMGWHRLLCPPGYPPLRFAMPEFYNGNGWSDHTIGLGAAKIALARGARIVEKHFVLAHNPAFPDDAWSMTPAGLAELVRWEKVVAECL